MPASQPLKNYLKQYADELRESVTPLNQAIQELEALENDVLGQIDIEEITIDNEQTLVQTYATASQIIVRAARGSEGTSKVAGQIYGNIVNVAPIIVRTASYLREKADKEAKAQALADAQAAQAAQKIIDDKIAYDQATADLRQRLGL